MKNPDQLRFHFIDVGHGDAILVELPDVAENGDKKFRFGLVDAGGRGKETKPKTLAYLEAFLAARRDQGWDDFIFEFLCLTHPHSDHYYGLMPVLEYCCGKGRKKGLPMSQRPREFWDCGFRYNTVSYLKILKFIHDHPEIQFVRVSSGTEVRYGEVEVMVLAPSIDMRNRYDTYGVNVNDASIVLRIRKDGGICILAADAHFDTWGKICEEFPRKKFLFYPQVKSRGKLKDDARSADHPDLVFKSQENQLNCNLFKVAHHGSKRGTSFEYLEKLKPQTFVISCAPNQWYGAHEKDWQGKFPHPLTRLTICEQLGINNALNPAIPPALDAVAGGHVHTTAGKGNLIFEVGGRGRADLVKNFPAETVNAIRSELQGVI